MDYFQCLSNEVILHIFSMLTTRDLCTIAKVSTHFQQIAYDRTLWRSFIFQPHHKKRNIQKIIHMLCKSGRLESIQQLLLNNRSLCEEDIKIMVQNTPNLKDVRFYNLKITEKTTQTLITYCPSLEIVHMHGGKSTDKCLELLSSGPTRLRHIDLQRVKNVTTQGLVHILAHCNLSCMNLREMFGSELLALAPHCSNFVAIDLSSSQVNDGELKEFLQHCHKLKNISLANCKLITDKSLESLWEVIGSNLTDLDISNCPNITNYGVNFIFRRFTSLVHLTMTNMDVSPIFLPREEGWTGNINNISSQKMQSIDLSNTDVKDSDVLCLFQYFKNLKKLCLLGCDTLQTMPPRGVDVIA